MSVVLHALAKSICPPILFLDPIFVHLLYKFLDNVCPITRRAKSCYSILLSKLFQFNLLDPTSRKLLILYILLSFSNLLPSRRGLEASKPLFPIKHLFLHTKGCKIMTNVPFPLRMMTDHRMSWQSFLLAHDRMAGWVARTSYSPPLFSRCFDCSLTRPRSQTLSFPFPDLFTLCAEAAANASYLYSGRGFRSFSFFCAFETTS